MHQKLINPLLFALCLAVTCTRGYSQQGGGQPPQFTGIILKVTDRSFVLVDKSGGSTTIKTNAQTVFQYHKNEANITDVLKFGMTVRGVLGPDDTALQVTGSHLADSMNPAQLKVFLDVSDDEWAVISAKIDQVRAARRLASGNNGNNSTNTANGAPSVAELQNALQAAYFDRSPTPEQLERKVEDLRRERAKAREALEAARKDLIAILTPKQEALLVIVGILD